MHGDDWFTLAELTERLGGLVWVEEQLSQLLAGWAANEASAPAAIFFATAGGHHAWHAQVVRGCLPTSPRLTEHDVVVAPTIGWTRTITTLGTLTDAGATLPRLKALVKVIDPWLDREIGALVDCGPPHQRRRHDAMAAFRNHRPPRRRPSRSAPDRKHRIKHHPRRRPPPNRRPRAVTQAPHAPPEAFR